MKRILFAIIALMTVINVHGADVTGALTSVADPVITYKSVDAQNREITLSAKIYYKTDRDVDFVMINCHPTITHNAGCPSGTDPQMSVVKYMVSENCLVVCPDYIGFGETSGTVHPYMCATLTGRNVFDAYKAAIKYVKETGKRTINSNYYTINVGYSQGGATALAFQRYLETEASPEDQELVNLRGSVCGAGPYNQQIVFDEYEKYSTLDYPIYLFYVLNGHKQAFGETTMRKLKLEECFTPEFWSYCQNNFISKFNDKKTNVDDLNTMLKNAGFNTFNSIINKEYKNHNSKVYRTIHKTLEQSNLLAEGWTPKKSIIFYHDQAGKDIVVPYECTKKARERFTGYSSYVDAQNDYDYDKDAGDNYLWHAAVFRKIWKTDRAYPGQITIILGAAITGNDSYNFNQLDHRTFGARFYAQFLAKRACMRPAATNTTGTARNTNIDPATPTTTSIAADAASVEGTYDRITTALPYNLPQGTPVFVQFAADVDGFYFGHDAPRYKVELNDKGEAISYTDMTNTYDDFKAGEVYLLSAVDADENNILSMTAGKTLATVASPLAWRELNMRKTGKFDGKSYVTNFLPFAYNASNEFTTYAVATITKEDGETYACAKALDGVIPAGTGTLIEYPSEVNHVILSPTAETDSTVGDNILTGNYNDIPNDETNFLLFGISNKTRLGFWYYPNLETVKAYTAYIDISKSGPVKGFMFDSNGDETAIEGIPTESTMSVWSIDGTQRPAMQKGLNIVRMSNGTIRKVMVK